MIHALSGVVVFASLSAACFVLARRFAGNLAWRGWTLYSIATGLVVPVFFVASVSPSTPAGFFQRIAIIAGWGWIALLAWRLLRSSRVAVAAEARPSSQLAR